MDHRLIQVCVTGASGYIGSTLVKKLLNQGYTVHATLRNLNDESKVELLKSFPGADKGLKLFEANVYRAEEFEPAIQGCEFVFHVATPFFHTEGHKYKNRVDATVDSARIIAAACVRSGTVRRLIYTGTVLAASPLKHDGSGFKEFMDESCWTPLHIPVPYSNDYVAEYTQAKTLTEKELLSFDKGSAGGMDVVTLDCGLVGGQGLTPGTPGSVTVLLSQLTNDEPTYNSLKYLESLIGKVPIVHIEDVCNTHILCITEATMSGRFLCANGYVSTSDIASCYQMKYPHYSVKKEHMEGPKREIKWASTRLTQRGFEYKYDWHSVLDDCIRCGMKDLNFS